jgi:hypothetical protein
MIMRACKTRRHLSKSIGSRSKGWREQSASPLKVRGSIDTAWDRVNERNIDPHAGLERPELLEPLAELER